MCLLTCSDEHQDSVCVYTTACVTLVLLCSWRLSHGVSFPLSGSRTGSAYHCLVIQYLWKIYLMFTYNRHFLFTPSHLHLNIHSFFHLEQYRKHCYSFNTFKLHADTCILRGRRRNVRLLTSWAFRAFTIGLMLSHGMQSHLLLCGRWGHIHCIASKMKRKPEQKHIF